MQHQPKRRGTFLRSSEAEPYRSLGTLCPRKTQKCFLWVLPVLLCAFLDKSCNPSMTVLFCPFTPLPFPTPPT